MRLGCYFVTVRFENNTLLPKYLGSTLRGAFGAALKTSICGNLTRECENCRIAERCLYAKTFEPRSIGSAGSGAVETSPSYVLEPPKEHAPRLNKGDTLTFALLLFGDANLYLPFFLNAFEMMGRRGIARRADAFGRGEFFLYDVKQEQGHKLFDPSTGRLMREPIMRQVQIPPTPVGPPFTLKVELQTPLRLKFQNKLQDSLPFHILVRAALRRISTIFAIHGDGAPNLDYGQLVAEASSVSTLSSQLQWLDWERYSNRQKRHMLLGGMVGSICYASVPRVYQPILEAASVLHLGKQSTFGLGKIALSWGNA